MRKWIRNWIFRQTAQKDSFGAVTAATPLDAQGGLGENAMRFQVYKAVNGKVIQVMHYKHNPHGPDWTGELFVVPDDGDLMDTIKIAIVSKALK